ncbi:hypothetical protein T492DRAFT_1055487 [Pavlovales sp. CCMP2436]|nr:hypothetical protein T492DRAFT_1055487 [Pavlovales sp. CCMP2436]
MPPSACSSFPRSIPPTPGTHSAAARAPWALHIPLPARPNVSPPRASFARGGQFTKQFVDGRADADKPADDWTLSRAVADKQANERRLALEADVKERRIRRIEGQAAVGERLRERRERAAAAAAQAKSPRARGAQCASTHAGGFSLPGLPASLSGSRHTGLTSLSLSPTAIAAAPPAQPQRPSTGGRLGVAAFASALGQVLHSPAQSSPIHRGRPSTGSCVCSTGLSPRRRKAPHPPLDTQLNRNGRSLHEVIHYQRSPQLPASGSRAQPRGSRAQQQLASQRAARVIQSVCVPRIRSFWGNFKLSSAGEFARVARAVLVASRAALWMQRIWRASRIRRGAEAIELAARRRARARRRVDDLASAVRIRSAACRIQQQARRQVELRAWQRNLLQENELYFVRMREELHRRSAITVQRYARGRLARRLAKKKLRATRRECATRIQAHFRRRNAEARADAIRVRQLRNARDARGSLERGGAASRRRPVGPTASTGLGGSQ